MDQKAAWFMNRFDYVNVMKAPPVANLSGQIVRFSIPGSGGSMIGIAQIDEGYELQANHWPRGQKQKYTHYEQIHYNHIDWESKEVKWHGQKIGNVLCSSGWFGSSYVTPETSKRNEEEFESFDYQFSKRYPQAK